MCKTTRYNITENNEYVLTIPNLQKDQQITITICVNDDPIGEFVGIPKESDEN